MDDPLFVTADEVIELNWTFVSATGEPHQIRDQGLLESAIAYPRNTWFYGRLDSGPPSLLRLVTHLAIAIARNHPFTQGNKRTGFGAMALFLYLNGFDLDIEDHELYAELFIEVIEGNQDLSVLEAMLRIRPI